MAARGPPENVDGSFRSEKMDQISYVAVTYRPRRLGLLAREFERQAIAWRERRPIATGQSACPFRDGFVVQARDREQHFRVTHSIITMNRARDDPKQ